VFVCVGLVHPGPNYSYCLVWQVHRNHCQYQDFRPHWFLHCISVIGALSQYNPTWYCLFWVLPKTFGGLMPHRHRLRILVARQFVGHRIAHGPINVFPLFEPKNITWSSLLPTAPKLQYGSNLGICQPGRFLEGNLCQEVPAGDVDPRTFSDT